MCLSYCSRAENEAGLTCRSLLRGSEQYSTSYWDLAPGRELTWTGDSNLDEIVQEIDGIVGHVSDDDEMQ